MTINNYDCHHYHPSWVSIYLISSFSSFHLATRMATTWITNGNHHQQQPQHQHRHQWPLITITITITTNVGKPPFLFLNTFLIFIYFSFVNYLDHLNDDDNLNDHIDHFHHRSIAGLGLETQTRLKPLVCFLNITFFFSTNSLFKIKIHDDDETWRPPLRIHQPPLSGSMPTTSSQRWRRPVTTTTTLSTHVRHHHNTFHHQDMTKEGLRHCVSSPRFFFWFYQVSFFPY
jgi:hypothetical protein